MSYDEKTGLYTGYIYMVECDLEPHKKYIGQTIAKPCKRWEHHIYMSKQPDGVKIGRLYGEMNKLGVNNFHYNYVDENSFNTVEELHEWLDQKERYYISFYDTTNPDKGYNILTGGIKGSICTNVISVDQYALSGEFINTYDCHNLPCEYNMDHVIACCTGSKATAYGYVWRYQNEPFDKYDFSDIINKRIMLEGPVDCYDKSGNLLITYSNVWEASADTGYSVDTIRNLIRLKNFSQFGKVFRYSGQPFDEEGYFSRPRRLNFPENNIYVYNEQGNFVFLAYNHTEVIRKYGVGFKEMLNLTNNHIPYISKKTKEVYLFSKTELSQEEALSYINIVYTIYVYQKDGSLFGKYITAIEAEKATGERHQQINKYLQGKTKFLRTDYTFIKKVDTNHPWYFRVSGKTKNQNAS